MKTPFGTVLLCLAAAFFCGCASRHAGPAYRAGDENPPDFLVGPVTMVLTNLNGFSAHVVSTVTAGDGPPHITSGELLGREGRLIYQPTLALKGKRARTEGGLYFIWDETRHSGYVLSEALQGYAPLKSSIAGDGPPDVAKEGIQEVVNGHPCHQCEAEVALPNGLRARLTLWQADDARHFPVRIEMVSGPRRTTLNFSEVRLEYPAQELFLPPDGFTPYASAIALMNELIVREASIAKRRSSEEFGEPGDVRPNNWHDSSGGAPYGQP